MDLIYFKNEFENTNELLNNLSNNENNNGIVLKIILNDDGKIILENSIIENENYIELENILTDKNLKDKIIMLNLKEDVKVIINNENIEDIIYKNEYFIKTLLEKTKNYQNINYFFTNNYHLIYFLKKYQGKEKIGLLLSKENSNFIDVDFYVIPLNLYNENFIKELLNQEKEIYMYLTELDKKYIKNIITDENILKKLNFIVKN